MIKNYILDTNVLIHFPKSIHTFQDNHVIIPIICLEELDKLKNKEGIVGYHAREAIREINAVRRYGNIHKRVSLPNGGTFRVEMNHMNPVDLPDGIDIHKNDNKIIIMALNIKRDSKDLNTILVTKDLCTAIKAESMDLEVQDYENDKVDIDNIYKGFKEVNLPSELIDKVFQGGLELNEYTGFDAFPNEFFCIKSFDNGAQEMTPHLAKLMLTRAGQNSKFIMIGDPSDNQIDNILVESKSNGLVYVIDKMKPFDITGHISLEEVERSPLAKIAELGL